MLTAKSNIAPTVLYVVACLLQAGGAALIVWEICDDRRTARELGQSIIPVTWNNIEGAAEAIVEHLASNQWRRWLGVVLIFGGAVIGLIGNLVALYRGPSTRKITALWRTRRVSGCAERRLDGKIPAMSARDSGAPATITPVAAGVRQLSVGAPIRSHVYLIDGPDGAIAFDAGVRGSGPDILAAAGGRVQRLILSHSHIDHRGAANELGAPIYCHPDEVADAEGDAGRSYTDYGLIEREQVRKLVLELHAAWDGGPVAIAGTITGGEEVAGFRVIHTPGHAPGQIALFRQSDRLLLAADAIYTLDAETGQPASPRVPHPFSNWDIDMARESIRRMIALDASSIWTGHAEAVTGEDIAGQLRRAADYGLAPNAGSR